jgi:hypothetical protein
MEWILQKEKHWFDVDRVSVFHRRKNLSMASYGQSQQFGRNCCHKLSYRMSSSDITQKACLQQHPLMTPSYLQRSPSIRVLHEQSFELLGTAVRFPDCAGRHAVHATY